MGKPNKALHLTTRALTIYESCYASWSLSVIRGLSAYRSSGGWTHLLDGLGVWASGVRWITKEFTLNKVLVTITEADLQAYIDNQHDRG